MQKKSACQFGVYNPRVCLAFLLCSLGAWLAVLSFAAPMTSRGTIATASPFASARQQGTTISSATVNGVTLSPAAINFGYQLVGTTGPQVTETVTNSGAAPLIITDISVSGRDRGNFTPTYSFTLPVTVAPGQSITINFSFAPALPWRAGTRNARLEISERNNSQYVPLTGIGATCLGPVPACSSRCPDSDGDGLNDAWEIAGGIDINNDGMIDPVNDLLLPGADPNRPDVYVKYDYMVATTRSPIGTPPHSHQPPAAAIQQVVDAFALHGVNLHIDPQHDAIPEVLVTTLDPNPTVACAGPDFVTMRTLRQQHLGNRKWAYHYVVFAHNATLPDTGDPSACPPDPECRAFPNPLSSGSSEIPGSSAIVTFGADVDQGFTIDIGRWAGTFMHELGHNFGLKHGSLAAPAPQTCLAFKPNYISVMDYSYQNGIAVAVQPGSVTPIGCNSDGDCPSGSHCTDTLGSGNVCYRVDYSRDRLLDLNEATLNEIFGIGGPSGDTDIVSYYAVSSLFFGPSFGPIDWNDDGNSTETSVAVDLDNDNGTPNTILQTANDWETVNGAFRNLNFNFQCTSAFLADTAGAASIAQVQSSITGPELGLRQARELHILYPPAAVSVISNPGQSNLSLKPRTPGTVQLALLGSSTFDVNQVELSSLNLHGAHLANISVQDVNNDGIPDLLLEFRSTDMHISPRATQLRLTGWLKNSRSFVGEAQLFR